MKTKTQILMKIYSYFCKHNVIGLLAGMKRIAFINKTDLFSYCAILSNIVFFILLNCKIKNLLQQKTNDLLSLVVCILQLLNVQLLEY